MTALLMMIGIAVGYLLMICLVCALAIKTNLNDEFSGSDGRMMAWILSSIWPVSLPMLLFMGIMAFGVFPVMLKVRDAMVAVVDWMTKPREEKQPNVELPKAKVVNE